MIAQRALSRGLLRSSRISTIGSKPTQSIFFSARRPITTESISSSSAHDILASQRLNRPVSPHLTIYQPQLTWYMSSFHRITGVVLSGSLYLFMIAYATSGLHGFDFSTTNIVKKFKSLPEPVKFIIKAPVAFVFAFHNFNGVRHLVWDTAKELSVRGVYRTGYTVLGLSAITTLGLLFV